MINGLNIKLARESRGVSQQELIDKLGISQTTLSRFEKGRLTPNEVVISNIANALDYPVSFFYKDYQISNHSTLFYRKRASMRVGDLSILEGRIIILSSVIDILLESINIPEFSFPHIEPSSDSSPSDIAFRVRNYFSLPTGPVENIVSFLEKNGVIVVFLHLGFDKFDGLTRFTSSNRPVIWINANMSNDRKRFTLAHELGHLIMHLRSDDLEKSEEDKEMEANEFASEFMLPRVECIRDFSNLKYKDLPSLKYYWKMSKTCMIRRAEKLGCISKKTSQYYYMNIGRDGERKQEVEFVPIDSPVLLKKMVVAHLDDLEYDIDELTDILGINKREIGELYLEPNKTNNRLRIVI